MHNIRRFQTLRFPWKFTDRYHSALNPLSNELEAFLQPVQSGFRFAVQNCLEAMVSGDMEFLKSIMEPSLYSEFHEGLSVLERRGHQIDLINQDSCFYTFMYNERIFTGLNIDREKNTGKTLYSFPDIEIKNSKVPLRNIHVSLGEENSIVFKIDVICSSGQKILITDRLGEIMMGKRSRNIESHKFTFECFIEKESFLPGNLQSVYEVLKHFVFSIGSSEMLNNWFITDIDDFLGGNPIIK